MRADGAELVAAVRRGDAEAVAALLEAGAPPDTPTEDGLPVLCLAIAAYDAAVAEALVEGGADPDRTLPDGTTPLTRAVAGGSPAMAAAVLGHDPRRLPDAERARLLALAREWYERCARDELRDRADASRPADTRGSRVMDGEYTHVWQVTLDAPTALTDSTGPTDSMGLMDSTGPPDSMGLMDSTGPTDFTGLMDSTGPTDPTGPTADSTALTGSAGSAGLTVREGHGAILTDLEWAFRVLTPVEELVARATRRRDSDHVDWAAARWVLCERRNRETWSAVTAYRHSPDPERRRFVLDVLHHLLVSPPSWRNSYEKETADLLVAWATGGEDDPGVLAEVLLVLNETEHPRLKAVGLRHAGHPDPRVRAQVPDLVRSWDTSPPPLDADARTVLAALAADEDGGVRAKAGRALIVAHEGSPDFADVIVGLLGDPVADVRASVAERVAHSADRTPAIADALAALLDEDLFDTRLNAAFGLLLRDDPRTADAIARVGAPPHPVYVHDHRLSQIWRWEWDHREESEAAGRGRGRPRPTEKADGADGPTAAPGTR
ncbi:ankyrin repeat domain-containing protein [Streptomyces hydrogenans]|uniref:ankyrin repeat domain-containing protein n=1 Tax=Streptomyces hydrogenans TaxID=1873719 RepID=UPI0033E9BC7E